jgi:hypothetical protein
MKKQNDDIHPIILLSMLPIAITLPISGEAFGVAIIISIITAIVVGIVQGVQEGAKTKPEYDAKMAMMLTTLGATVAIANEENERAKQKRPVDGMDDIRSYILMCETYRKYKDKFMEIYREQFERFCDDWMDGEEPSVDAIRSMFERILEEDEMSTPDERAFEKTQKEITNQLKYHGLKLCHTKSPRVYLNHEWKFELFLSADEAFSEYVKEDLSDLENRRTLYEALRLRKCAPEDGFTIINQYSGNALKNTYAADRVDIRSVCVLLAYDARKQLMYLSRPFREMPDDSFPIFDGAVSYYVGCEPNAERLAWLEKKHTMKRLGADTLGTFPTSDYTGHGVPVAGNNMGVLF